MQPQWQVTIPVVLHHCHPLVPCCIASLPSLILCRIASPLPPHPLPLCTTPPTIKFSCCTPLIIKFGCCNSPIITAVCKCLETVAQCTVFHLKVFQSLLSQF